MSNDQQKAASSATVTVACKLPHGLVLEVGKKGDDKYKRVELRGANHKEAVAGYGLTRVAKEIWDNWLSKTGNRLVPVKKGLVFAQDSHENAMAQAADGYALKTGLERLTPKDFPKGVTKLKDGDKDD